MVHIFLGLHTQGLRLPSTISKHSIPATLDTYVAVESTVEILVRNWRKDVMPAGHYQ